jgi:hypothetical protein
VSLCKSWKAYEVRAALNLISALDGINQLYTSVALPWRKISRVPTECKASLAPVPAWTLGTINILLTPQVIEPRILVGPACSPVLFRPCYRKVTVRQCITEKNGSTLVLLLSIASVWDSRVLVGDLRFSWRWRFMLWHYGLCRHVFWYMVTKITEEYNASIFRIVLLWPTFLENTQPSLISRSSSVNI